MDTKCLKKSTMQQFQRLVDYMEENPDLARGTPAFGTNKLSAEKQWKNLCESINALGPPSRTIAEWKKTWADLKSRTKKISENTKSLQETGGGLYRYSYLTALEQVIDRTLLMTSAGAPGGRVFGDEVNCRASESIEDCFQSLVKTPPKLGKAVAVVKPTGMRSQEHIVEVVCHSVPADKNLQQSEKQTTTTNVPAAIGSTYRNDTEHQLHRPKIVNSATQQQTKSASKRRTVAPVEQPRLQKSKFS